MDFAELSNDPNIINKLTQFYRGIDGIENILKICTDESLSDKLTNTEKIKLHTLLSFSLNSLFWMHLRAEGADPKGHDINGENDRLKRIMIRAQEISMSKKPTPKLDTNAAKRFIRSGLWEPKRNEENIDQSVDDDDEEDDGGFELVGPSTNNT
ncbi:nuclear nucleic acid-binding protein C1D [Chelonus insularis]|uniref:nuclear nucleic acid-binding protein C1D n=1 Tax=Chelonus insularis TaxID=460826 RepID=UPI00158BCFD4|nr:nuclear nucleic acid-binding protein C1D [Chelonus insularis]